MRIGLVRKKLVVVLATGALAGGLSAAPAEAAVQYVTHVYRHDMDGDGEPDQVTVRTVKSGNSYSNPATATVRVKSSATSRVSRLRIRPLQIDGSGTLEGPLTAYDFERIDGNRGDELLFVGLRGTQTIFHVVVGMSHGRLRLLRPPGSTEPAPEGNLWFSYSSGHSLDRYSRRVSGGTPIVTSFYAHDTYPGSGWELKVRELQWKAGRWAPRSDRTFIFANEQDMNANFDFAAYGTILGYTDRWCLARPLPSYCPRPPHPDVPF